MSPGIKLQLKSLRAITIDPNTGKPYTQDGVCDAIEISNSQYRRLEAGRYTCLNVKVLMALIELFDCGIQDLIVVAGTELNGNKNQPKK